MISKIKEFLKPNFGKIILTAGFGLAAYFFGINSCVTPSFSSSAYLAPCHYVVLSPVFWGPAFLSSLYGSTINWGSVFLFPSRMDDISAQLSFG